MQLRQVGHWLSALHIGRGLVEVCGWIAPEQVGDGRGGVAKPVGGVCGFGGADVGARGPIRGKG